MKKLSLSRAAFSSHWNPFPAKFHTFPWPHYHVYVINSTFISPASSSPPNPRSTYPTVLSTAVAHRHLKFHISTTEFTIFTLPHLPYKKHTPPKKKKIHFSCHSLSEWHYHPSGCSSEKTGVHPKLHPPLIIQAIIKSYQSQLLKSSQMFSHLSSPTATLLVKTTISSFINNLNDNIIFFLPQYLPLVHSREPQVGTSFYLKTSMIMSLSCLKISPLNSASNHVGVNYMNL